MKVLAPGKLVLTGAYAVLDGAPAIVAAVDRYASALASAPDDVDVRPLHDESGRKLGLGSSAASMVVSEGARRAARGEDLRDASVRAGIFRHARAAHAAQQAGGSGVDVAASVHGGVLRYRLGAGDPLVTPVSLPSQLVLAAFFSGSSARTSDLRARVDAASPVAALAALKERAERAADAVGRGDAAAFVQAAGAFGRALEALGSAADAPIVPPSFAELARLAEREDGAFLPSGAGGGDVGIWLGMRSPSDTFSKRASALAMRCLTIGIDRGGVRLEPMAT